MATAATPIDGLDEVELTEFVRLQAEDFDANTPGTLADIFPVTTRNDIRYSIDRGIDTLIDEATYRAWDAESPIGRRPGLAKVSGELLPISRKIPVSEYEQLRSFGTNDDVIAAIYADGPRLARGIFARLVRARWQLLLTGKVSINENRVQDVYDSGRDASLTVGAVAPAWSDHANATPMANIVSWNGLIHGLTGIFANRLKVSRLAMTHLQQVDEVRGAFMPAGQVPNRITQADVEAAFLELAGVTIEVVEPIPGMIPSPLPDNSVVLLRDNVPLGTTLLGTPLEARRPRYSGLTALPGVVAGGWENEDPATAWSHAVAIGLPLLAAPDLTLSAQVLA